MKAILARLAPVVLMTCAILDGSARGTSAAERIWKYAFGTPTSVTRAGFTKVTVNDGFTSEKGYGFGSVEGLLDFDRGGSEIKAPEDPRYAAASGAYRTTSDITCALVEGQSDNAFLVALPDGTYTVWLIASDAEWDPPLFEVWANGQKKLDVRIARAGYVYMEPFQARAAAGQLRIELKGKHGWILSGLLIGKEGPELAKVVEKTQQEIFFLTDQQLPRWKEIKYVPLNPPLELTAQEEERGYVVFPADYTEPIVPAYIPSRAAIGKPLAAFAAPGEFEPATLCVSARKDLGSVAVEVSDFVAEEGGHTISGKRVDVGIVRCWPVRETGYGDSGEYRIVPEMIEPPVGRACRVDGGQVKQWWLTVHVPADTPAGRYRMSLTVRPETAPPTVVEWCLLILPFQLKRPADKHWGAFLETFPPVGSLRGPERRGRNTPAEADRLARADIVDYGNHGFDLAVLGCHFTAKENADGSFTYDISKLARILEYWKALGTNTPAVVGFEYTCRDLEYAFAEPGKKHAPGTFSDKAHKAIVGLVTHIRDEAQRHGWPKIYYYPIDEPGNNKTENRYQFAENVLNFVHEVPGCQTATALTAACVQRLGDHRVDLRMYAYGSYNRNKALQDVRQGRPFLYYDNGIFYGHSVFASRGMTGFEFLRSGSEGAAAWGFDYLVANPYNDFDGPNRDWNVLFPGVDKSTPTIYWELCREGVDDCRYVATLQEEIRQAKQQGKEAKAQHAERILAPLVDLDAPRINNSLAFGRYRWRIAREILSLRGDRQSGLPAAAVIDRSVGPEKLGPNCVENPSFEDPPKADGLPGGRYDGGHSGPAKSGVFKVTDEVAHSGRYSLKWDISKVADAGPGWVVVNVGFSGDTAKRLQGKRVKVGCWYRLGAGTAVPELVVRTQDREGRNGGFTCLGGVEDAAVWNHFEAEGRLARDLEGLNIHIPCPIPEAATAKNCYFFMDDVSLEPIEEPPVAVSTPLDEYYVGETVPWSVTTTSSNGEIKIALLQGERVVAEQGGQAGSRPLQGTFETRGLAPDVYTVQAAISAPQRATQTARRQIIVAPDPFDWKPAHLTPAQAGINSPIDGK